MLAGGSAASVLSSTALLKSRGEQGVRRRGASHSGYGTVEPLSGVVGGTLASGGGGLGRGALNGEVALAGGGVAGGL